ADVAPVDVAFDPEHERSLLPIVTDGSANETAGQTEVACAVPVRMTPASSAVDAEIETGPVVGDRRDVNRGNRRLVAPRQVGGRSWGGGERRNGRDAKDTEYKFFHSQHLLLP